MSDFHHPLVEALRASVDLRDDIPFILPFDDDYMAATAAPLGSRPALVSRHDGGERSALIASNRSFIRALAGGLEVPGDLLEQLLVRRSIGRVRYELAATEAAFVVTRRFELTHEYRAFVAAMAGNLEGWHPVENEAVGDLAHDFPLWRHRREPPV